MKNNIHRSQHRPLALIAAGVIVPLMLFGVLIAWQPAGATPHTSPELTLTYSPAAIEEEIVMGGVVTNTVTVTNSGTVTVAFAVVMNDLGGPSAGVAPVARPALSLPTSDGNFPRGNTPLSAGIATGGSHLPAREPETPRPELAPLGITAYTWNFRHGSYYSRFNLNLPEVLPITMPFPSDGQYIGAGEYVRGRVYMVNNAETMWEMDPTTGAILRTYTATTPPGFENYVGMALDPTNGTLYAASANHNNGHSSLYIMDPATGMAQMVGAIANAPGLIAIAIDGQGNLWGYSITDDVLLAIDKETAVATVIGSIGFDANFGQGMAYDPATDTVYMAAFNSATFRGELRAVDTTTGNTALVGVLGETLPGNVNQVFWLGIDTGNPPIWAWDTAGSTTIPPQGTATFKVIFDSRLVKQTGTYLAELNFSGTFSNSVPPMPLTMHVIAPVHGLDLSGDMIGEGEPAATLTYTLSLTNTGNISDTFDLALNGAQWDTQLSTTSLALGPGLSSSFVVSVTIPAGTPGGAADTVQLMATSAGDPSVSDSALITSSVPTVYGVSLGDDQSSNGEAGELIAYSVPVTNTGNTPDTFNLALSEAGWTTLLSDGSVSLEPGAGGSITVLVVVPFGVQGGAADTATIVATSTGSPDVGDEVDITTSVAHIYGVSLYGENSGSGPAGESVYYELSVTNTGNATDTFILTLSGNEWPAELSAGSVSLAAGESATITLLVSIPAGAAGDAIDTATVIATSAGEPGTSATLNATTIAEWPQYATYLPLMEK